MAADGDALEYSVPAKDVKVFRFSFGGAGVGQTVAGSGREISLVRISKGLYVAEGCGEIKEYRVYGLSGSQVASARDAGYVDLRNLAAGVYVVEIVAADGSHGYSKVINN